MRGNSWEAGKWGEIKSTKRRTAEIYRGGRTNIYSLGEGGGPKLDLGGGKPNPLSPLYLEQKARKHRRKKRRN